MAWLPVPTSPSRPQPRWAELDQTETAGLLNRLIAVSLLDEHRPGRYTLHDLLRSYAAEHATKAGPAEHTAALQRLLDYYLRHTVAAAQLLYPQMLRLATAQTAAGAGFADLVAAAAWLDAELSNLVAACLSSPARGPRPYAIVLGDALRGYLFHHRRDADWETIADAAMQATDAGDLRSQSAAHLVVAGLHGARDQHELALEHYRHAENLASQDGWLDGQAAALGNLGTTYIDLGQPDQAADHLARSAAIHQQLNSHGGQALGLLHLGQLLGQQGDLEQSAAYHRMALELFQRIGSRGGEASALAGLGEAYHQLGDFPRAVDSYDRAIAIHQELGNRTNGTHALTCLALTQCDLGDHPAARVNAERALAATRDIGDHTLEANALIALAAVEDQVGRTGKALEVAELAVHTAELSDNAHSIARSLLRLAITLHHIGEPEQAKARATAALAHAEQSGFRVLEGQVRNELAVLDREANALETAIEQARAAIEIYRETGHRPGLADALIMLAELLPAGSESAGHWREAKQISAELGRADPAPAPIDPAPAPAPADPAPAEPMSVIEA